MNPEDPRWCRIPVFRELHDQWWRSRGSRLGQSTRAYSRDWERLLEAAGLVSGEDRAAAERDARRLAEVGWIEIQPPRFRPEAIEKVQVPVAVEWRLASLFGDPLPQEDGVHLWRTVAWEPELSFLRESRVAGTFGDWEAIHRFLSKGGRDRPIVPIKERSLEIFGDEKRLDALLATAPFRDGRVGLEVLRCRIVVEPLGWRRGPDGAQPVLVIENLATWDSYARWNERAGGFSAVVYGKGLVFAEAVAGLEDVFREVGGVRPMVYFGDLDPTGLEIPWRASRKSQERGWGPVLPHVWSYRRLLSVGVGREGVWEGDPIREEVLEWMGAMADPVRELFARGKRLAQEHVGWEELMRVGDPAV